MNTKYRTTLILEVKELILETMNITDVSPDEIMDDEPIFAPECALGLDSVDALELINAIQGKYKVRLNDQNIARHIIESVKTIVDFLENELSNRQIEK